MNSLITNRKNIYYIASFFLIWIMLFEFLLPVNKILPKPSLVIDSFVDLFTLYKLHYHLLSSTGVIYVSILFAYLLIIGIGSNLYKTNSFIINFIDSFEWYLKYIPGIVLALFLIMWFPGSELIEFIFAFLTSFFSLLIIFKKESKNVKEEYISAAKSLGADDKKIYKSVVLKCIQPAIIVQIKELHFYLWALLIAFEYIKGGIGVGSMMKDIIAYNDLSALFSTTIIISFVIGIGSSITDFIKERYFSWKS